MLEVLMYIGGYYLLCVVISYGWAVFKNWEFTNDWDFRLSKGCVGVIRLPKILTFWMGKRVGGTIGKQN